MLRESYAEASANPRSWVTQAFHGVELLLAGLAVWFAMAFGMVVKVKANVQVAEATIEVAIHLVIVAAILSTIAMTARAAVFGIIEKIGWDSGEWTATASRKLGVTIASIVAIYTIGSEYMETWSRIPEVFGLLAVVFALQIAIVRWVYKTERQRRSSQEGSSQKRAVTEGGEDGE